MEPPAKGTVTPLASMFSEEEAKKAASYVEEKIEEKRGQMNHLQQFVDENSNLINLVKKLPDQLHHNVMVPFGKMAFFPGRLIHTNEFLVLLGENYYSEKTSKQTVDFLKRRDKTLQSQIHALKAEIEDFQTEAKFFATTASEAAEGLVEIREEYVEEEEEDDSSNVIQSGVKELLPGEEKTAEDEPEDDDEFARIMSRLRELEMEEEQEGETDGDDKGEEEQDSPIEIVEEESDHDKITGEEATIQKVSEYSSSIPEPRYSEARVKGKDIEVLPRKHPQKDLDDPLKRMEEPKAQYLPKEDQSRDGISQQNVETWKEFQASSAVSKSNAITNVVGQHKIEPQIQKPEPKFDSNKAFTGSIVEHADNLDTNPFSQAQSSGSKPSKPVSRFKAQRR